MPNNGARGKVLKMLTVVDIVVSHISYPEFSELVEVSKVQEIHLPRVSHSPAPTVVLLVSPWRKL